MLLVNSNENHKASTKRIIYCHFHFHFRSFAHVPKILNNINKGRLLGMNYSLTVELWKYTLRNALINEFVIVQTSQSILKLAKMTMKPLDVTILCNHH